MIRAWQRNEFARGVAAAAAGKIAEGDLTAAEEAFDSTDGDFASRFIAAVESAVTAGTAFERERHVRIPETYAQLGKSELEALARPFADFLRSHPTRAELLEAVAEIDRRQREHAQWAPYVLVDPLPPGPQLSHGERFTLGAAGVRAQQAAYEARRQEYYDEL